MLNSCFHSTSCHGYVRFLMFVCRGMRYRRFMLAIFKWRFCIQMMLFSFGVNWPVNVNSTVCFENGLSSLWNELMQRCLCIYLYFTLACQLFTLLFFLCSKVNLLILCALQYFGVLSISIWIGRQCRCIIAVPRNWGMQHCHCKTCCI